ncbi:hypothetical protein H4582DRAFT_131605 [Lactarius indigo]|nr:hypothetical protein H4582DRAFT_131605 [Lactarius indigo]
MHARIREACFFSAHTATRSCATCCADRILLPLVLLPRCCAQGHNTRNNVQPSAHCTATRRPTVSYVGPSGNEYVAHASPSRHQMRGGHDRHRAPGSVPRHAMSPHHRPLISVLSHPCPPLGLPSTPACASLYQLITLLVSSVCDVLLRDSACMTRYGSMLLRSGFFFLMPSAITSDALCSWPGTTSDVSSNPGSLPTTPPPINHVNQNTAQHGCTVV